MEKENAMADAVGKIENDVLDRYFAYDEKLDGERKARRNQNVRLWAGMLCLCLAVTAVWLPQKLKQGGETNPQGSDWSVSAWKPGTKSVSDGGNPTKTNGDSSGGVTCFRELEESAAVIVRAEAVSVSETDSSRRTVLRVSRTVKGETAAEITVVQPIDTLAPDPGQEYFLFLGAQEAETQAYFAVGGYGILAVDAANKSVTVPLPCLNDADLQAFLQKNLP